MRVAARLLVRLPVTLLFVGLFGWLLVRLAPGFGVDEREIDSRFSAESIAALQAEQGATAETPLSYARRFLQGDFGTSQTFGNIPIAQLIQERWALTTTSVVVALMAAWVLSIVWAGLGALWRPLDWSGSVVSFSLLALPSGLVAVGVFLIGAPVALGIAAAVFPVAFRYTRQLVFDAMSQPCIFAAAARGVSRISVLVRHARALAGPQLISLIGASAAMAVGAAIPMEAICDSPGLGQLAWKAALARDLPTLMPLILLIATVIQVANIAAEARA
ncbi:peptide ABC transporter [Bryobacterales bacterium F-183]|nr:peptide ABC transporter [Bryobacterales bacterium F-183]